MIKGNMPSVKGLQPMEFTPTPAGIAEVKVTKVYCASGKQGGQGEP